ncbi:MAG: ATP-binding protein [Parvularcula sp.]|jgi:signal transduction histidine kinase|nr:ATP-binding protein [Parvularcula sp.]
MRVPRLGLTARLLILTITLLVAGQCLNVVLLTTAEKASRQARTEAILAERMVQMTELDGLGPRGARFLARRQGMSIRRGPPPLGIPIEELAETVRDRLREESGSERQVVIRRRDGPGGAVLVGAVELGPRRWATTQLPIPNGFEIPWRPILIQTLVLTIVLLPIALYTARRVAAPLRQLTAAADGLLSGGPSPNLPARASPDIAALANAYGALEARVMAALEERDVMLGALGHDLRTPMASLRIKVEEVSDEALREEMIFSIERLAATLDDIVTFSKAKNGGARTVMRTDALVRQLLREEGEGDTRIGSVEGLSVEVAPETVLRALRNLVENARRYSGGAEISVEGREGMAVFAVRDHGPGIPDSAIARLMRPFERGDTARHSSAGGSGLGLAIARATAEAHGGELRLFNHPAGGLIAELALPLAYSD